MKAKAKAAPVHAHHYVTDAAPVDGWLHGQCKIPGCGAAKRWPTDPETLKPNSIGAFHARRAAAAAPKPEKALTVS